MSLDYLVIGHVTRDLKDSTFTLGGTAAFAARTARALGCRVGIVTSVGTDLDLSKALSDVMITRLLARTSTTFENVYTEAGRRQMIHDVADFLGLEAVPENWRGKIVHIGPVARECDPALTSRFEGAFVGVTPQGWMRQWDDAGYVSRRRWQDVGQVLPHADAVVLSEEDVGGDWSLVTEYASQTRRLVLTQGARGCTVYADGDVRHVSVPRVDEVDSTGAGDVFAASLFYALQREYDVWTAARFANCTAARSVTRSGLCGTPLEEEVAHCSRVALSR